MVERRNTYLRGLMVGDSTGFQPSITVNVGDVSKLNQLQGTQVPSSKSPMQKLLQVAKDNGGTLSVAQAVMYTELEPQEVQKLLLEAQKHHLAEITNDPNTGAIRYHFDV